MDVKSPKEMTETPSPEKMLNETTDLKQPGNEKLSEAVGERSELNTENQSNLTTDILPNELKDLKDKYEKVKSLKEYCEILLDQMALRLPHLEKEDGCYVLKLDRPDGTEEIFKIPFDQRGIPDFSPFAETTVTFLNNDLNIFNVFKKADEKCAEQWNQQKRDGRSDWTAKDVREFRKEGWTWHECADMKTLMLVPTEVHDKVRHTGGRAMAKLTHRLGINVEGLYQKGETNV